MNKCKICGGKTRLLYDKQFDIDYFQCLECEFVAMDSRKIVDQSKEKEVYDRHNNSYENEGYVNMFRNFIDSSIVPFLPPDKNIEALDFGSGPEPVLSMVLKEYGFEVDIYDLFYSPEKVYLDKKYDLLTCTEVIEHLENPMQYFSLFKILLKEGGIMSMMTLFHPNDDEVFSDWFYRRDETHISFYTPKTIVKIAEILDMNIEFNDNKRCFTLKIK